MSTKSARAVIIISMNEDERKLQQKTDLLIREWFLLTALAGGFLLYKLASVGDPSLHGVLFGYSASRLLMMAVLLAGILAGLAGLFNIRGKFCPAVRRAAGSRTAGTVLTILFLILSLAWLVCGFMTDESFRPWFERISPLLLYAAFVSGSGALLLSRLQSLGHSAGSEPAAIRKLALSYFYIAFALYLFIRLTGVGIVPDEMDWQPTGMAIQYWEIGLGIWAALALSLLLKTIHAYRHRTAATVILFFAIWIGTALLWVTIPTMEVLDHSYFMEITEPNMLPYPASDAANFGLWAESILAGLGFKTTIAYRQFLIVVIAFFEHITSRDILKTIDCVTVTLALIPACLYLLGRRLHSHGAGILAAVLAAMREYNTILLAPHFMVSSAKMWLSDLPAMLCLIAAVSASVSWFRRPRSVWRMLLAGCLMGLCVTVRSQFIALIPFPALFFLISRGLPFKKRIFPALGFCLAALFVIAPWFIRSKILTGDFILDEPGVHSTELARRWSDDVNNVVSRNPGETDAEYAARNKQHMIDFFLEKPGYVIGFTASHFFANQIYALTALPFGTDPALTINDVTNTDFHDVEGRLLKTENAVVLVLFLIVITLGMSAAWKRAGWAGLLPFFMCSLYLGVTSAARYSGWRFALPADWHYYFYFALGLAEIGWQVSEALAGKPGQVLTVPASDPGKQPLRPAAIAGILLVFLVLGCAPALCGEVIPQQIFLKSTEENIREIEALPAAQKTREILDGLLNTEGKTVLNGRVIYPRFFYADRGLASGHPWIAYRIRDFSRLGFVLLNEENHDVILPLKSSPGFIPNAADVYVIGQDDERGFFRADAVIIPGETAAAAPTVLTADTQE